MSRLTLSLAGDRSALQTVADELDGFCSSWQLPMSVAHGLQIALDELLSNTVSYGFEGVAEPRIDLLVECPDNASVRVEVADNGNAFDPRDAPAPDLDSDVDDRAIGGLGIHLVQNLMDDLMYERRDDRNVVTLVKRFDPLESAGERAGPGPDNS